MKTIKIFISSNIKYYFILIFTVLFISCSGKKNNSRDEIARFLSTTININDDLTSIVRGKDSIINKQDGIRMIIYYDSIGCGHCRVNHLYEMNDIFEYFADSFKIAYPMIIFSPSESGKDELLQNLKNSNFSYPAWLDTNKSFLQFNPHIPQDNRLHTFLLDKNNKVVLVGNPVDNAKMWDLYKKTINELIENGGEMKEQ